MRFDSGPEVFVRVNRNYVLTEYVLNENVCIQYSHVFKPKNISDAALSLLQQNAHQVFMQVK